MNETSRRMVLWVALLCISVPGIASAQELTVFRARRIITMDPSLPIATTLLAHSNESADCRPQRRVLKFTIPSKIHENQYPHRTRPA